MQIRKRLTAALGLSALGAFGMLGSLSMAPQAYAQGPAHSRSVSFSSKNICLFEDTLLCLTNHGAGNFVDVEQTNIGIYHTVNVESNDVQIENAAGNCLREFADGTVGLASGGCSSTNPHEFWVEVTANNGRTTFQNGSSGDFMGTFGDSNDDHVFGAPPQSGFFTGWELFDS